LGLEGSAFELDVADGHYVIYIFDSVRSYVASGRPQCSTDLDRICHAASLFPANGRERVTFAEKLPDARTPWVVFECLT